MILHPLVLYGFLALGAVGVFLALPRPGVSPQPLGALLAAVAAGLIVLLLTLAGYEAEGPANLYFYIFAVIALGASLRMITHPRPVYAALFFILTILSSSGLYLVLSAEFMAFALVIIYAGAILITYLFVIMLATQAPSGSDVDALAEYDRSAREPLGATVAGFVLLAVLTSMMFRGVNQLPPSGQGLVDDPAVALSVFPRKVEDALRRVNVSDEWPGVLENGELIADDERVVVADGKARLDMDARRAQVIDTDGRTRWVEWPEGGVNLTNVEGIGYSLLAEHPGSIEIAGIILLMAMLGAVVLARKRVEAEEAEKAAQLGMLTAGEAGP